MAETSIKRIGRYEVQEELGRGGYGRVYRAYDPTVGRLVAIKILTAEGKDILTRFRNEAAAAGNLNHRNIVTIYDFGDFDGVPYIAMEFLAGDDLSQLIANRAPLTLLQKVSIMLQVADGLYCAHRNGIVHRDVKPANIRLLPDGTVKIMDFGIARVTRDTATPRLTLQGDLLGTLLYMSPEQVMGGEVDSLTDIFAYGVTYYELLTGQHPFHASDPGAVLYKITSQDPPPVRTLLPECPEPLEQVIRRALQRERELRYPSLRELQIDTEPILLELRQERARQLLEEARRSFAAGDLDAARAQAMEALDLDPANRETRELRTAIQQKVQRKLLQPRIDELLSKGQQALDQRRISEALESFEAAFRLDSTNQQLKGQVEQVRALLERSRSAARKLAEARREFTRRDFAAALRSASEAIEIDPDNADAARFLDQIRAEAERQARYEQAVERAKASLERNLFDDAEAALVELDTRQRDSAAVKELLAGIAGKRAEFERRERLRAGVETAEEYLRNDAFSEAAGHLKALGREFPDDPRVAELLRQTEAEIEARQRAEALANIEREAGALADARQFDEARALIERSLRTYPGESRLEASARRVESAEAAWMRQRGIEQAAGEANALRGRQRYAEALDAIDAALGRYGDDPALSALRAAAAAELAEQQKREAVGTAIGEAENLIQNERPDEAIRTLEAVALRYPGQADLGRALERAREALARKRRREAVARVERQVGAMLEARAFAKARDAVASALRGNPGEPRLEALREEIDAAEAEAARARRRAIAEAAARALALSEAEQFDEALEAIRSVQREHGDDPALQEALSRVEREREARRLAKAIEAALAKARSLVDAGAPGEAVALLEPLAARHAGHEELQRAAGLAREALERQRQDEAVAGAGREAMALLEQRAFARAREIVAPVLSRYPGDARLENLRGEIDSAEAAWRRRQGIDEATKRAEALRAQSRFDEALKLLDSARRNYGDDEALAALTETIGAEREARRRSDAVRRAVSEAAVLLKAGNPDGAIRALDAAAQKYPGESELDRALSRAREALAEKQKNEALARMAREAGTLLKAAEFGQARRVIEGGLRAYPGEARLVELREQIEVEEAAWLRRQAIDEAANCAAGLESRGDFDRALAVLDDARRRHGEDPALASAAERIAAQREAKRAAEAVREAVAEAAALLDDGRPDDAVRKLEAAESRYPGRAEVAEILGRAREERKRKQRDEAIQQVEQTARGLAKRKEFGQARQAVQSSLRSYPGDSRLVELQTEVDAAEAAWQRQRAIEGAVERAEGLQRQGKLDKALELVEAARRRHGDDPALASLAAAIGAEREELRRKAAAAEQARREQAERERAERERVAREQAQRERELREQALREQAERERVAREQAQREQAQREQARREQAERERARREQAQREEAEREQARREKEQRELALREQAAREQAEREKAQREQAERERAQREQAQREEAEREQARREKEQRELALREQAAREQAQREQAQREQAERERARREQAQREEAEREQARREKEQRELALREQAAREQAEREKAQRERAERERAQREQAFREPTQPAPEVAAPAPSTALARRAPLITPKRAAAGAAIAAGIIAAALLLPRAWDRTAGKAIPFEIRTDPPGATVTYEGGSCVTPNCRLELNPGDHAFEARLPGHRPQAAKAVVARDSGPRQLDIRLEPLPAQVQLTTNFADGSVLLDGRPAGSLRDGQFSLDAVEPGRRRLELKSSDGGATLEFETGAGRAPSLPAPPKTQNADAVVITSFSGEVVVNCADCSGEAVIDGVSKGRFVDGRIALKGIADGAHELEIKSGSASRKVVFDTGSAPLLSAHLTSRQDKGILVVETGQDDAVVYVNGRRWPRPTARGGQLTITLETAEYVIRAEKPGYQAKPPEIRAAVRKGEQVRAPFRLEPLQATLTLAGQSPGAMVLIDGKNAGAVNGDGAFTATVPPGERRIELSKEGYQPVLISRVFGPGEGVRLGAGDLQLRPVPRPPEPKPVKATPQQTPQQASPPPPPPRPDPAQVEAQDWERVRETRDASALADFLSRYPGGRFARQAEARIEELDWNATDRNNRAALDAFLRKHPRGQFADPAAKAIAGLEEAERRRAEVAAILDTIQRYQEAYKREDAEAVRALYLKMPSQQFDEIRNSFRVFQVLNLQLTPDAPQVSGDTAVVRCARTLVVKDNRGAELPVSDVAVFTLSKQGNQWRIASLASQKR